MAIQDILFIVGIIAVMYLFILRPKIKEQKDMDKMLTEMKKGDKVLTTSGIYAEIQNIRDNVVTLKVSPTTTMDFAKSAIAKNLTQIEKAGEDKQQAAQKKG